MANSDGKESSADWGQLADLIDIETGVSSEAVEYVKDHREDLLPNGNPQLTNGDGPTAKEIMERVLNRFERSQ